MAEKCVEFSFLRVSYLFIFFFVKEPTELYLVVFSTFFHVDKSSLLKNKSF